MRARSRLWFSGAAWMAPVAVGLGVLLLSANELSGAPSAVTAGVHGAWPVIVVAPVVATGAAITGGTLRRAQWHVRPTSRSTASLLAETLWPHVGAGVLALVVTTVIALVDLPYGDFPDLRPLAAASVVVVAFAVLGFALGQRVWMPLALVAASGGTFYLLAFRVTVEPLWLRHLGGVEECCQVYETLSNRVPAASILAACALLVLGAVVVAFRPQRTGSVLAGAGTATVLLAMGVVLVSGMGSSPATLRTGEMTCRQGVVEYCVWPEQGTRLAQMMRVGDTVLGSVSSTTGAPLPTALTASRDLRAGENTFEVPDSDDDLDVAREIGSAAAPALTNQCALRLDHVSAGEDRSVLKPEDASRMLDALWIANAWWQVGSLSAMGWDETDALSEVLGEDPEPLAGLLGLRPPAQADWISDVGRAAASCDISGAPTVPREGGDR
jgi:hypothetical protein